MDNIFIIDFFTFYTFICIVLCLVLVSIYIYTPNILMMMIWFELIVASLSICFVFLGLIFNSLEGQLMTLIFLTVSAAESAVILSLITVYLVLKNLKE